jgi:hypothetical protein
MGRERDSLGLNTGISRQDMRFGHQVLEVVVDGFDSPIGAGQADRKFCSPILHQAARVIDWHMTAGIQVRQPE